jgi:hypothetical protein
VERQRTRQIQHALLGSRIAEDARLLDDSGDRGDTDDRARLSRGHFLDNAPDHEERPGEVDLLYPDPERRLERSERRKATAEAHAIDENIDRAEFARVGNAVIGHVTLCEVADDRDGAAAGEDRNGLGRTTMLRQVRYRCPGEHERAVAVDAVVEHGFVCGRHVQR